MNEFLIALQNHLLLLLEGEDYTTRVQCCLSEYFQSVLDKLDPHEGCAVTTVADAYSEFRDGVQYISQVAGHA